MSVLVYLLRTLLCQVALRSASLFPVCSIFLQLHLDANHLGYSVKCGVKCGSHFPNNTEHPLMIMLNICSKHGQPWKKRMDLNYTFEMECIGVLQWPLMLPNIAVHLENVYKTSYSALHGTRGWRNSIMVGISVCEAGPPCSSLARSILYFTERWRSASMFSTCSHQCWRLVQQRWCMCNHVYVIMHVKDP